VPDRAILGTAVAATVILREATSMAPDRGTVTS
jgi:hypothetical protein